MDKQTHVTAKASKPAKAAAARKVSHMQIERADNGFTTTTHMEPMKGRGPMGSYEEPQKHVFPNASALKKHVAKSFGDKEDAKEDAKEGGKEEAGE